MRSTSQRKRSSTPPPREVEPRTDAADEGCIYCLPPAEESERAQPAPDHECMIKRLGSWERRQVSVLLHKAGFREHLFTCGCPASQSGAFRECPFYETEDDLDEDP